MDGYGDDVLASKALAHDARLTASDNGLPHQMVARQRSPTVKISQLQMAESHTMEEIEGMTILDDSEIKEIEMVPWKNTHDMRPRTLAALASSRTLKPNTPLFKMRCRTMTSAAKSLDILRQNLQVAINKEIDLVIKKYLEKFFTPAVRNVRENLGAGSVTEELIREVCRAMLEEAKQMYCSVAIHKSTSPPPETDFLQPEQGSVRKRKASEVEVAHRRAYPPYEKWDPSRVNKETQFILSTTAGKILGLGSVRDRISVRHPDLVKYMVDQDDREWLSSAGISGLSPGTPSTALMLLDDIVQLANFDEYRSSALLHVTDLKGFVLPDFIQRKVRAYMTLMRTKYIEPEPSEPSPEPAPLPQRLSPDTQIQEDTSLTFDDAYLLSASSSTDLESLSPSFSEANAAELSCVDPSNILPSYIRIQQPIQMSVGVECLSPIATSLSAIDTGGLVEFDTSFLTLRGEEDD